MCVPEAALSFQAVAEGPVHADVGGPDERQSPTQRRGQNVAERAQPDRDDAGVPGIVEESADAGAGEVPGHEEVRRQHGRYEQRSGDTQGCVERRGGGEDAEALQSKEELNRYEGKRVGAEKRVAHVGT